MHASTDLPSDTDNRSPGSPAGEQPETGELVPDLLWTKRGEFSTSAENRIDVIGKCVHSYLAGFSLVNARQQRGNESEFWKSGPSSPSILISGRQQRGNFADQVRVASDRCR